MKILIKLLAFIAIMLNGCGGGTGTGTGTGTGQPTSYSTFNDVAPATIFYSTTINSIPNGNHPRTVQVVYRTTQGSVIQGAGGSIVNWGNFVNGERFSLVTTAGPYMGNNGNQVLGSIAFVGQGIDMSSTPTALNDNKWHVVTCIYDGTSIDIYADGILINSQNTSPIYGGLFSTLNTNGTLFSVGAHAQGEQFIGDIARVTIWDVALTGNQIATTSVSSINLPGSPISSFIFSGRANPPATVTDAINPNIVLVHN